MSTHCCSVCSGHHFRNDESSLHVCVCLSSKCFATSGVVQQHLEILDVMQTEIRLSIFQQCYAVSSATLHWNAMSPLTRNIFGLAHRQAVCQLMAIV